MSTEHERDPPAPRRRRRRRRPHVPPRLIAFVAVLCAGVLIGWVLFSGDESEPPSPVATTGPRAEPPRIAVDSRRYPRFGLTFGLPRGWETSIRRGVLNAASGDDVVSVAISAAGGPGDGREVRRSDRRELTRLFRARELTRQRAQVGSAPTIVTELMGRTRRRTRIRILSMAASSRWRTYSIQVFTVLRPSARRLFELRKLLGSVRYGEPR